MKKTGSIIVVLILISAMAMGGCVQSNIAEKPEEPSTQTDGAELGENPSDEEINAFITAKSDNPDKVVLRYASTSPDLNGQSYLRGCREFLKVIKMEMGDQVQIEYYLNSTFGGTADAIIGGLQNKSFELTDWPLASFAEYTNAFQPLDVPYLVADADGARALYLGEAGTIMKDKCIEDTNVIPLFYGQIGMRQITNSKNAIKSPDDMKGLKLRVQNNPIHIAGLKALGASPTSIPFSELFTALQQKTVDGQENPLETISNFNFYDVQSYLTISNHLCALGTVAISKDFYDQSSAELRAAIDKAAKAAEAYIYDDLKISESKLQGQLGEKIEIYTPTEAEIKVFQDTAKQSWPEIKGIIGDAYFTQVIQAAGIEE